MDKYGILDSTLIKGRNFSFVSTVDVENGSLVTKGAAVTGSKDVFNAGVPTTTDSVFVVGNPAWSYDTSSTLNQNEDEFINIKNKPFRVYELSKDDQFTIADYSITPIAGTPLAVGQFVGLENGSMKPKATETLPTDTAFIGKIINIKPLGMVFNVGQNISTRVNKVTIEVVKN